VGEASAARLAIVVIGSSSELSLDDSDGCPEVLRLEVHRFWKKFVSMAMRLAERSMYWTTAHHDMRCNGSGCTKKATVVSAFSDKSPDAANKVELAFERCPLFRDKERVSVRRRGIVSAILESIVMCRVPGYVTARAVVTYVTMSMPHRRLWAPRASLLRSAMVFCAISSFHQPNLNRDDQI